MGANWSVDGSYTLGEQLNFENKLWKIYPAESRSDSVSATVFIHGKEKDENIYGVDKAVKYLRTLRHPGLLKCHEVFDNSEELSVVTEAVVPLENVIGELNTKEIIAGIHGIITTVTFLHKCNLSHNNLCLGSIFVGQNDACWKIAGFECILTFSDMTSEFLARIKPFRELQSIPPEEVPEKIQLEWVHAQDSFGLGKLISDIFHEIDTTEEPTIDNFQLRVETELLHPNYQERPQVSCLLNDDVFQNGYIEILEFLNNITIKSNEEKTSFFRDLHNKLQDLPPKMVANRLLHLLLSRLVLVDPVAVEIFLPHLLTPSLSDKPYRETDLSGVIPLLPHELYKESCLPILRKLFDVKDHHVRMILLKYFHLYVGMFEKDVLQKDILHKLMLGLHDSDDELVSSTFNALQHLVPLLGSKVVIGGERMQQFTERRPKVEDLQSKSMPWPKDQFNKMTLLSKDKQDKSETVEDKIKDCEKRREETRKRNEERRNQNKLLQMQKLKAKKANEVEEVHYESDNDFELWEEFSPEREQNFEVSDGSEHGRPSSSENLSLDSGFSERIRIPSSNPVSPRSLTNKSQRHFQTNTVNKTAGGGGMKLGKTMQKPKKDCNQINANLSTSNCDAERTMTDKHKRTKKISSKSLDKKKTIDAPWEDYEINVVKKKLGEEDLFADMRPSLLSAPTAPVKGISIYSDKLAVESQSNEVADGWNNEEW